ncbi:MAG: hypothetical protein FIA94_12800 [Nitrospirae bacterium]|nr:hypothetical protein [Nitrospirota bacterium]
MSSVRPVSGTTQKTFSKSSFSREIRHVSEAIINLYAAHVNSYLYPYDHPLVSDSLKNSYQCLQRAFQKKSSISLEMKDNGVLIDGESPGEDLPVFGNFSAWMRSNQIGTLSISNDLTRRELIGFHKIISLKRYSLEELLKAMTEKSISSISALPDRSEPSDSPSWSLADKQAEGLIPGYESTMLNEPERGARMFSGPEDAMAGGRNGEHAGDDAFSLRNMASTEGHEPSSDPGMIMTGSPEASGDEFWPSMEALLERALPEGEKEVLRNADPVRLAHLLNMMLFSVPREAVIGRITEACFGGPGYLDTDDAKQRCLVFLKGLKPVLRPAFRTLQALTNFESAESDEERAAIMNVPAETYDRAASASASEQVLGPYSPYVRRTVPQSDFMFDFVAEGKAVLHDIELRDEWAHLFHSEHLAQFRTAAAGDDRSAKRGDTLKGHALSAALVLEACAEEAVSDAAFSVMLELIETDSLEGEAYQALTEPLASAAALYAEKGVFEKVLEIFNALKSQALQGKNSFQAAMMLNRIYSTDQFNAVIVESLRRYGRKQREAAGNLARALRSSLIPYLLDALSDEPDISKRRFMISLLTAARGEVLVHIMKRLRDSRWYVLRNMLFLLRECHGRSHASEAREFLSHDVPLVRLEALRTLLSFQDPAAEPAVVKLLSSENFQLQKGAVLLAGAHRIREALPHLVRLLREKDIMGKRFLFKRTIIRALGRIGHGSALNPLLRICRETSMVHKEDHDRLRLDIYKTLHHYPVTAIKPFIDYGLRLNNREIVALSRKLAERHDRLTQRQ